MGIASANWSANNSTALINEPWATQLFKHY